jgi:hypothetical protein
MRPWRKVHAGLITSDKLANVSDGAAFLYTLLLVAQDDAGCYPWTPAKVRALCVNRPWTSSKITALVKELVGASLVEACGTVLHIGEGEAKNGQPAFSRLPFVYDETAATWLQRSSAPAVLQQCSSTAELCSSSAPAATQQCLTRAEDTSRDRGDGEGEWEWEGKPSFPPSGEGDQVGDGGDSESPATADRKKVTEFRNSGFTVTEELVSWAQANLKPGLAIPELRNHTLEFSEYWTAQPTKRSLPGWERTWKNRMLAISERKLAKAS